jgi:mono/diheme cytochrome c family protein
VNFKQGTTIVGVVAIAGTCAFGVVAAADRSGRAGRADRAPTAAQIEFARGASDLMTNTVVAALLQEINETTPANVAQGNLSIGLIFNDRNRDMRLVGTLQPMSANDLPADDFERRALAAAMTGAPLTSVERVAGDWYYRRSIPLTNFQAQCAMCHASYAGLPATAPVGALVLRVPIAAE